MEESHVHYACVDMQRQYRKGMLCCGCNDHKCLTTEQLINIKDNMVGIRPAREVEV